VAQKSGEANVAPDEANSHNKIFFGTRLRDDEDYLREGRSIPVREHQNSVRIPLCCCETEEWIINFSHRKNNNK
jgi:hypothetical protein